MLYRLSVLCLGLVFTWNAALSTSAELPQFPLRTDWVGDDVLVASTAGGPDSIPQRLPGVWRVSLCVKPGLHRGHAWIRYQNVHTGDVHTIGRFQRYVRPTRRRGTRETLYPRTNQSELHCDYDWRFEHEVRQGKYIVDSVVVRDPIIFGHEDVRGHGVVRDNCITYARDAWQYYSGQQFDLALLHTPACFLRSIDRESRATPSNLMPAQTGREKTTDRMAIRELRRLPPVK